jgi:multidrug efflux pump subunit AcrB
MKRLIAFFVERPLLVNLMLILIVLGGLAAMGHMTFEMMPKVDLGLVNITTLRPGAGPEDVELSITVPLEEELLKVSGLEKLTSNSMEGISVIAVRLDPDVEDKQRVLADIQKAVDRAGTRLPADLLERPLVEEMSTLKVPVMELHLSGRVPEAVLRASARRLADALREVPGIAGVEKIGYRQREVRVLLDPERLQHLRISVDEIRRAIRSRNVRSSGGSLTSFVAEKKVLTVGQFSYPKQVAEVVVRSTEPGNSVRVRDLAQVVLDYEDWQVQSRTDGRLSIALLARKKAEADGLDTAAAVRAFVERERPNLPPGVTIETVNDTSRFVYDMLDVLGSNALLGFVLVFGCLWLFLSLRLALWVSLGLPVALLLTFTLMPLAGLGIDVMTLTALILMLGMLVDDGVVTAESIQHRIERGQAPLQAAAEGAAVVASPVIVSSLTTVLAFLPVAFLGGLEGKFLWMLPVMVALTLGASLVECLFMLPGHLAHGRSHGDRSRPQPPRRWFRHIQARFDRFVLSAIRHRYLTIGLFVAGFVAILAYGALVMRFNLYPEVDIDTVNFKIELPEGSSFDYTIQKCAELEALIRERVNPADLLNVTTRIGHHDTDLYGATEGRNPAWALLTLYMLPQGQRATNSNELIAAFRREMSALPGYRSIVVEPLKDTPVAGKPVELEIIGNDAGRFALATQLENFLKTYPGVTEVWTSYKPGKDLVELELDHQALADRGLTVAAVTQMVRVAFDGLLVDELQQVGERIRYRLQFRAQDRGRMETLENLVLINDAGQPVYLRSVAYIEIRPGEAAIRHYLGQRTLTLYGDIDRSQTSVQQVNDALAGYVEEHKLLQRYPDLRLWYGGELEQQRESLGNIGTAFAFCALSVFVVLVLLFNSLSQPFLILAAIPFGLAGVIVGFGLQGEPLSMIALIGILGLIGVLVNDSLVLVHTLNRMRTDRGDWLGDRGVADGTARRLRPIVITSVTTVAALLPTAYGLAGSNPFITPMVLAMAWGILFGTLISLVLMPCLYAVDQDVKRRLLGRRFIRGVESA